MLISKEEWYPQKTLAVEFFHFSVTGGASKCWEGQSCAQYRHLTTIPDGDSQQCPRNAPISDWCPHHVDIFMSTRQPLLSAPICSRRIFLGVDQFWSTTILFLSWIWRIIVNKLQYCRVPKSVFLKSVLLKSVLLESVLLKSVLLKNGQGPVTEFLGMCHARYLKICLVNYMRNVCGPCTSCCTVASPAIAD